MRRQQARTSTFDVVSGRWLARLRKARVGASQRKPACKPACLVSAGSPPKRHGQTSLTLEQMTVRHRRQCRHPRHHPLNGGDCVVNCGIFWQGRSVSLGPDLVLQVSIVAKAQGLSLQGPHATDATCLALAAAEQGRGRDAAAAPAGLARRAAHAHAHVERTASCSESGDSPATSSRMPL